MAAGGSSLTSPPAPQLATFYAVYAGDTFGRPERGIAAIMASAHPELPEHRPGAREAAQLVVHSFAEGYFGAARTFSAKRAANLSLLAINNWLFSQLRTDLARHLVPVSMTALLFAGAGGTGMGVVRVGAGCLYRRRAGHIIQLAPAAGPAMAPHPNTRRAIGLDAELSIEYSEEAVQCGDSYLLASGAPRHPAGALPSAFALDTAAIAGATAGAAPMRLDILASPPADDAGPAALAGLPIRPAPREGDNWDGFIIGKTIYQGRYTILKAAYDSVEHREVALKIPLRAMLQDQIFAAGFMREAWVGATVHSRHVARYIDPPPDRRASLYLVLPLYRGETLEARLHRAPPVSLPDGIGIALTLCEAVQDLASLQIIHRDLKPDNIMLLDHNEIKLLDLGLAYLPGIDTADAAKPGGTLRYMAPELLTGTQANPRTEVYALAVTIYRMFAAGAYPFGRRETTPLARARPDLPSWLGTILARALSPDPTARFADAAALAAALHTGLVTGAADSAPPPFLSPKQTWRAAAIIFALLFLALLLWTFR